MPRTRTRVRTQHSTAGGAASTFAARAIHIYFNSKRANIAGDLTGQLRSFIATTKSSLDCAIYDLRAPEILTALRDVADAGKTLRLAYDGGQKRTGGLMADPKPSGTAHAIAAAGLAKFATPVHMTGRHLMHDKFLVRDGRSVWTGSANFTVGGLELQDNNCLVLDSAKLAAIYKTIFKDLITAPLKPASKSAQQPLPIGSITFTPYFAPDTGEGVDQLSVRLLEKANKLRLMFFLMSDPDILGALARFKKRGADIKGIYDKNGMNDVRRFSKQPQASFWFQNDKRFVAAPSHAFSANRENDFMHNKTMIIDDKIVITGSYNFSENAEANDENLLLIESRDVATAYNGYFDVLYAAYGGRQ
jgi:phosphatidylserine/phosphatidylglycerophosphate/cardiolipin synthase-like enzyme